MVDEEDSHQTSPEQAGRSARQRELLGDQLDNSDARFELEIAPRTTTT